MRVRLPWIHLRLPLIISKTSYLDQFSHLKETIGKLAQLYDQNGKNTNETSSIKIFLCFLFCLAVATTERTKCLENEFECMYPEDGCIPYEATCNRWIDCMRDGSDESPFECGESGTRYRPLGMFLYLSKL